MTEERLCSSCRAWRCRAEDAWCGYCGSAVAQIEMRLVPESLHVGEIAPSIRLELANASCARLRVKQMTVPGWLKGGVEKETLLEPGEHRLVWLRMKEPLVTAEAGEIAVATDAGGGSVALTVIDPNPEIVCGPAPINLWMAGDGQQNAALVKVWPTRGGLRVLRWRMPHSAVHVTGHLREGGEVLDERSPLTLSVRLATAPGQGHATLQVPLAAEYKGPHGTAWIEVPLNIEVKQPPHARWTGQFLEPEVRYAATGQRLWFEIRNQSSDGNDGGLNNGVLTVTSTALRGPTLEVVPTHCVTRLPLSIEGGASAKLEFELDLRSLESQPAQLIGLSLELRTNGGEQQWDVPVKVQPLSEFEGVVAIDFGSSNSCCAVWSLGAPPKLVPIDENDGLIAPTVVRYISLASSLPMIETGAKPKRLAAEYLDVAASTVDRLKQRLGDGNKRISVRPEEEKQWVERDVSQVASDYLRKIREMAEVLHRAKFRDFILTHPARCSFRQFARLREALEEAFGSQGNRVQFLQEPIAALMGYFWSRSLNGQLGDYTVAAFDLGGGTTDVALVRVEYDLTMAGRIRVRPRVLYCHGERFGGEDLTDFLVAEFSSRCQNYLSKKHMGREITLIGRGLRGAAEIDIRRNWMKLVEVAERFKASLSLESTSTVREERIELRVIDEGRTDTQYVPVAELLRAEDRSMALEPLFIEYVREQIAQRAERLRSSVEATGATLDAIQLSGKTTYLPVVQEAIAAFFPGVSLERAGNPKECVVMGACQTRSLRRGAFVVDVDTDAQRMTSTIGVFGLDSQYFQPILVVDTMIPAEGLVGELANAWDGREPVVLWEDLLGNEKMIEESEAALKLERIGAWTPIDSEPVRLGKEWTIRVRVRVFQLSVVAVGPDGSEISFRPMQGDGG